jgi:hypothetical protein
MRLSANHNAFDRIWNAAGFERKIDNLRTDSGAIAERNSDPPLARAHDRDRARNRNLLQSSMSRSKSKS